MPRITYQLGRQMLFAAINDPNYTVDSNTGIDGFEKWIKGVNLNKYRKNHYPLYPRSPDNGRDWHRVADRLRRQNCILKYRRDNRVFFVLPEFQNDFEDEYPDWDFVPHN
jgi:hypothetical protein